MVTVTIDRHSHRLHLAYFAWLIGEVAAFFKFRLCKLYLLFSLTSLAVARALLALEGLDHDEKKTEEPTAYFEGEPQL